ncbi:hypothetical protein CR194_13185 [Salipaludibacillus keqinensis]|uniref:L-fucose isomerase C-terminal domain-containing protein n=1 Tax=Salipaludibacillus keqinensis TaxID=2045207 RepID=A0A323TC87_9BACI|nr:hypothetical protein [Salipaludibacillus keqinensis]PYZ92619.1 hypothetical protein CR194_13185 [Salipaludibacillus keqinensis]
MANSILYLPIARKTFNMEEAEKIWKASSDLLSKTCRYVKEPEYLITSPDELEDFLATVDVDVDTIVYQSVTFADGEFIQATINKIKVPVVVWSVREPVVGQRLMLNSLTGGNSTCHVLQSNNRSFSFVFGNPDEAQVKDTLASHLSVTKTIYNTSRLCIGVVGDHPPGFYFSGTNKEKLQHTFGVTLKDVDLLHAFKEAKEVPEERWKKEVDTAENKIIGLNRNDETVMRFAQFTVKMRDYIEEEKLSALAIRCWPDFFNELGAAACSTLSHLTDESMVSACESDIHGSLSMYILNQLSGGAAPYLGDMVHINQENNAMVFWHCGAGAYSLASQRTGAKAGVHPNRKMGLTMEFGLKPGKVTIFRVGATPEGYRLLVFTGEALDVPQRFNGTTIEVAVEKDVQEVMQELMLEGFEPHYAIVHADVRGQIKEFGRLLNLPVVEINS